MTHKVLVIVCVAIDADKATFSTETIAKSLLYGLGSNGNCYCTLIVHERYFMGVLQWIKAIQCFSNVFATLLKSSKTPYTIF